MSHILDKLKRSEFEFGYKFAVSSGDGKRFYVLIIICFVVSIVVTLLFLSLLDSSGSRQDSRKLPGSDQPGVSLDRQPIGSEPTVYLKITESGTLGGSLAQSLVKEFFRGKGISQIETLRGRIDRTVIWELLDPNRQGNTIRIMLRESLTTPSYLDIDEVFIGNLFQTDNQFARLRTSVYSHNGLLRGFLIALDSLVLIVHPENPIIMLSKDQVGALLTGTITNWREMHGNPGKIDIYAPRTLAGSDLPQPSTERPQPISSDLTRFASQTDIVKQVAENVNAIGLIGSSYLKRANEVTKTLGISVAGAIPVVPNRETIAERRYPFSRPIYFYTSSKLKTSTLEKFINFTRSRSAREIIAQNGYIVPEVIPTDLSGIQLSNEDYNVLTKGAIRLPVEIQFEHSSIELDPQAYSEINRVSTVLNKLGMADKKLMLFGFTDSSGLSRNNLVLSEKRALVVDQALQARGIRAELAVGMGAQVPVARDNTIAGRNRNRRVELWLVGQGEET